MLRWLTASIRACWRSLIVSGRQPGGEGCWDVTLGCSHAELVEEESALDGARQVSTLEFSRDRKMMSVRCRQGNRDVLFVKGAPESVLACCTHVRCTLCASPPQQDDELLLNCVVGTSRRGV